MKTSEDKTNTWILPIGYLHVNLDDYWMMIEIPKSLQMTGPVRLIANATLKKLPVEKKFTISLQYGSYYLKEIGSNYIGKQFIPNKKYSLLTGGLYD